MICWPVSPRVGNVKNNDSSLIEPITARVIPQVVDIRHCGTAGFPAVFAVIRRSIAFPSCSIVDLKTPALPPGFSV
jgi:hypothetical protein